MPSILDAAFNLVHAYPGGATSLAPRMGKRADALSHEVRGHASNKLGLVDAEAMTQLTGDPRILNTFAENCGFYLVPKPNAHKVTNVMVGLALVTRELSEFVSVSTDAEADNKISANELRAVNRELADLIAAAQSIAALMAAKHAASCVGGE